MRLVHAELLDLADLDRVTFRRLYDGHVYLDCREELAELEAAIAAARRP